MVQPAVSPRLSMQVHQQQTVSIRYLWTAQYKSPSDQNRRLLCCRRWCASSASSSGHRISDRRQPMGLSFTQNSAHLRAANLYPIRIVKLHPLPPQMSCSCDQWWAARASECRTSCDSLSLSNSCTILAWDTLNPMSPAAADGVLLRPVVGGGLRVPLLLGTAAAGGHPHPLRLSPRLHFRASRSGPGALQVKCFPLSSRLTITEQFHPLLCLGSRLTSGASAGCENTTHPLGL